MDSLCVRQQSVAGCPRAAATVRVVNPWDTSESVLNVTESVPSVRDMCPVPAWT